jgi:hypothetical protein
MNMNMNMNVTINITMNMNIDMDMFKRKIVSLINIINGLRQYQNRQGSFRLSANYTHPLP